MTISYAGRLDPLACGKLLLLIGETNKNRLIYEKADKEYKFTILFGISTDSYDILGLINNSSNNKPSKKQISNALNIIKKQK